MMVIAISCGGRQMARIVLKTAKEPIVVDKNSHICMCGLSHNQPYCDGSHKQVSDELEKTYFYHESGRFVVSEIQTEGGGCSCGDTSACADCPHK
jgi:CDGSH-type Zn-finger protein